jgi:hypothetical protein
VAERIIAARIKKWAIGVTNLSTGSNPVGGASLHVLGFMQASDSSHVGVSVHRYGPAVVDGVDDGELW